MLSAQVLTDLAPGDGGGYPSLTRAGDRIFFTKDDGAIGGELWVTDGTVFGTHLVRDINPGSFS